VTGVDGTPAITANIPQPTSTSVTSFECNEEQTGEECCQQGGSNLHWCSGSFPNQFCYNSESQICCSNGIVCDGAGCCALVVSLISIIMIVDSEFSSNVRVPYPRRHTPHILRRHRARPNRPLYPVSQVQAKVPQLAPQ
jgi:hypothetical protein